MYYRGDTLKETWKKIAVFLLAIVVIVTSFMAGNYMSIATKNKVTMSREEYNKLVNGGGNFKNLQPLKELIQNNFLFEIDDNKLEEYLYKGLFQGLEDPYSVYMNKDEFKSLMESSKGEFAGVGIVVTATDDGFITVVSAIEGTPAYKAGIKSGDRIIKVGEENFSGEQMDKAVEIMRGKPGTEVKLTLSRDNKDKKNEIIEVKLKREIITMRTVSSKLLEDNLGYISISQFDQHTYEEFKKDYLDLKSKGAKGIVLDLRGNPGGVMSSTVEIADMLLPEGPIVKTVDKYGKESIENSDKKMEDLPLVVLVNQGSASASEVLTGALRDYDIAKIVGTKTFGKGIVQKIFPLTKEKENGPGVKLTVSEYFTPKGTKINKKGIEPDYVVELPENFKGTLGPDNLKDDIQLQKAIEVIKEKK